MIKSTLMSIHCVWCCVLSVLSVSYHVVLQWTHVVSYHHDVGKLRLRDLKCQHIENDGARAETTSVWPHSPCSLSVCCGYVGMYLQNHRGVFLEKKTQLCLITERFLVQNLRNISMYTYSVPGRYTFIPNYSFFFFFNVVSAFNFGSLSHLFYT